MASAMDRPSGRYVAGGTTEVLPNRLGWWERVILPKQNDDIQVTIKGNLVGRADLIAYLVYGDENYEWVVRQYNTILDDETELAEGKVISLPAHNRVY